MRVAASVDPALATERARFARYFGLRFFETGRQAAEGDAQSEPAGNSELGFAGVSFQVHGGLAQQAQCQPTIRRKIAGNRGRVPIRAARPPGTSRKVPGDSASGSTQVNLRDEHVVFAFIRQGELELVATVSGGGAFA